MAARRTTEAPARRGRPPAAVPRDHAVTIRLTAEEYGRLAAKALAYSRSPTELAQQTVIVSIGGPTPE